MFRRQSRNLGFVLGALALAGAVTLAGLLYGRSTLLQVSGAVRIADLHGPVTVARDHWGVPHIYAGDDHDLFVAQGYITAQDRLWQMLLRRQAARGQLSDWLGDRAESADVALGRQVFAAQAASASPDPRADAYALGVNACLKSCPEPPELTWLKRQGKIGQIAPWTATDSAALQQMIHWAQSSSNVGLSQALSDQVRAAHAADLSVSPAGLALPVDPTLRLILRLAGIPLQSGSDTCPVALEAPSLPAPWYMASLHSERYAIAGATWPGLPGAMAQVSDVACAASCGQNTDPQRALVARLLELTPSGWLEIRVHGMLRQWDYDLSGKTRLGNASAAVYQAWVWHLARDTFRDELGEETFARYWATGSAPQALGRLAARSDDPWWDDVTTTPRETRDDILRRAYAEALDDLGRHYGDLHTIWEWDAMHAAAFRHPLGGQGYLAPLLDRTVKLGGDSPFDPAHPDDLLRSYGAAWVSSLQIKLATDRQLSFALAGGQSGNPFSPHYADLLPLWARGQFAPLQDAPRPQSLQNLEGVLVLTP